MTDNYGDYPSMTYASEHWRTLPNLGARQNGRRVIDIAVVRRECTCSGVRTAAAKAAKQQRHSRPSPMSHISNRITFADLPRRSALGHRCLSQLPSASHYSKDRAEFNDKLGEIVARLENVRSAAASA
jgi:hypothetical protein